MTTELDPLVSRYQHEVVEPITPELDAMILGAAAKLAATRRRARRFGGGAIAAATVATVVIGWQMHRTGQPAAPVNNSGRLEGATRLYLMQVDTHAYSGPGLQENPP